MSKKTNYILFFLALFLFSYTTLRAYLLSITWDEAYSYLEFVRNGIVIPCKFEQMSANNHLLNTFLDIGLVKCFGPAEFVLRIPSLFSHLLFLYFSYRLVRNFSGPVLAITSFVIINFNPYLLDFFSLSRGYGLSIGLMMTSVFFLFRFVQNEKGRDAAWSTFFAVLATLANFVMLNFMVVLTGLILVLSLREKGFGPVVRKSGIALLVAAVSLLFILPMLLKLKDAGALFYGGRTGFWTDTFSTIVDRCFYERGYSYWFQRIAKGIVIVVVAAAGAISAQTIWKRKEDIKERFLFSIFFLLFFCALSTIVQHYVLGTLYLQDRTALFLVVLFSLLFVAVLDHFSTLLRRAAVISCLTAAFALVHFALASNFHYVLEWKWDANIKQMLSDLEKIKVIPKGKQNVSIGIPLEMDQGINYYRATKHLDWLNTVERSDLRDRRHNYLFFGQEEERMLNMDSVEVLKRYPRTNNVLARPRYPLTAKGNNQFQQTNGPVFAFSDSVEYGPAINYVVNDSIMVPDKNAELVYDVEVLSPDPDHSNLFMVVSIEGPKGPLLWKRASIKDYLKKENEWTAASFSVLVPTGIMTGNVVKAYIWNPNKQQLQVRVQRLSWLRDQ